MLITVEATYVGGVLKLRELLPLVEHETVRVTVQTDRSQVIGRVALPPHDPTLIIPAASEHGRSLCSLADDSLNFAESEMLNIWLDVPPSPTARTVVARRGELPLPDPPIIPPDDDEIK